MTKTIKYAIPLAGIMMFVACGDDSSSSPAASRGKFILDEDNQKFALIYDGCYISENTTRWDENVDTVWFRYKFIGDTLVYIKDRYTRDEGDIMVGGHAGSIFGTWKSLKEDCDYEDGEIYCREEDEEDEYYNSAIYTLDVSRNNIELSLEMEKSWCSAEDFKYEIEDMLYENLDDEEFSDVINTDCSTVKFEVNGKSVTATISESIGRDNVYTRVDTYTSGKKTCQRVFKTVPKLLQMAETLCNADNMSEYINKFKRNDYSGYVLEYDSENEEEIDSCLSDMFGAEIEYYH